MIIIKFLSLSDGWVTLNDPSNPLIDICSYDRSDSIIRSTFSNYGSSSSPTTLLTKVYRTSITSTYTIHTPFLSQAQSDLISLSLLPSPSILLTVTEDSLYDVPAIIVNDSADFKNSLNSSVVSYDISFRLSPKVLY